MISINLTHNMGIDEKFSYSIFSFIHTHLEPSTYAINTGAAGHHDDKDEFSHESTSKCRQMLVSIIYLVNLLSMGI